jgi:hypothetical protein
MVTCQRGSRGCLSTGRRPARAARQAESFGPTSSWARCSTTHYLTRPQLLDLAEEIWRLETLTLVLGRRTTRDRGYAHQHQMVASRTGA